MPLQASPSDGPRDLAAGIGALRLAIQDLQATFGPRYPGAGEFLVRLEAIERSAGLAGATIQPAGQPPKRPAAAALAPAAAELAARLNDLRRQALLANPLLDFDRLLLVKRHAKQLGLPHNWQSNSSLPRSGYDNEIALLRLREVGPPTTVFRPADGAFVGDIRLHFDAGRLLLSMPVKGGRWQVHELVLSPGLAGGHGGGQDGGRSTPGSAAPALRQVTPAQDGVDNYDACYLPDGAIIFTSTACMQGVPCVAGGDHVANLCRLEADGKTIRQLCFEQDHDWHPSLLPSGRVIYARWEYSDLPHAFNRLLFTMNPDGTEQMECYGSNSYWPNAMFYPKAVPGHPTRLVAIVSGHHGAARMGEMILLDPAVGRHEADGAIQRIGSRGRKVEPVIRDALTDASWPKFLHPWPLSEKYFLAACRPDKQANWGIYLVDVFDNFVCLAEAGGYALLEPVPLKPTPRPPVVQPKVDLTRSDALVYLGDVYSGPGLAGVPRGTVRSLRLFTYHYAYQGVGGQQMRVGLDGPWDVKRVLGTVPVEADGSAYFRVPANTPISIQPLDADGAALQLMRSWMTAMPGEIVSCAGCHERQSTSPPNRSSQATRRPPSEIAPWYGPPRGFSFVREVQPVLDKHCVGCHDGKSRPDGRIIPDLRDRPPVDVNPVPKLHGIGNFPPAYYELRRRVRGHTAEGDLHLLTPADFHASTTHLVQMLRRGHQGLKLDAEAWDRLITWIDLNTPCHGTWGEVVGDRRVAAQHSRRRDLRALYAGVNEDPEHRPGSLPEAVPGEPRRAAPIQPDPPQPPPVAATLPPPVKRESHTLDLGEGVKLDLVALPAGEFAMGQSPGPAAEGPTTRVRIAAPFWMGRCEVTNRQYRLFDPSHDSRRERAGFLHFDDNARGHVMNGDDQPVVRVSWLEAMAFCRWLSGRTGRRLSLPTEAQWEYACRAGTTTPLWFGPAEADFTRLANLADYSINAPEWRVPRGILPAYIPAVHGVNDRFRPTAPVGSYQPNPWGLCDMHGNAAEWTRSSFRPYPWADDDRNAPVNADPAGLSPHDRKAVRGGSFYDRPARARSAFRQDYPAWQRVYDVGFRVVCD